MGSDGWGGGGGARGGEGHEGKQQHAELPMAKSRSVVTVDNALWCVGSAFNAWCACVYYHPISQRRSHDEIVLNYLQQMHKVKQSAWLPIGAGVANKK